MGVLLFRRERAIAYRPADPYCERMPARSALADVTVECDAVGQDTSFVGSGGRYGWARLRCGWCG